MASGKGALQVRPKSLVSDCPLNSKGSNEGTIKLPSLDPVFGSVVLFVLVMLFSDGKVMGAIF